MFMKKTIDRYIKGYKHYFATVKAELSSGRRTSHWIWFIFPQIKGLGCSPISNYYAFENDNEVREFWNCKELRVQLTELIKIALKFKDHDQLEECLGTIDTMKFHSSMTVFWLVTKRRIFKKALKKFYDGIVDELTVKILARNL